MPFNKRQTVLNAILAIRLTRLWSCLIDSWVKPSDLWLPHATPRAWQPGNPDSRVSSCGEVEPLRLQPYFAPGVKPENAVTAAPSGMFASTGSKSPRPPAARWKSISIDSLAMDPRAIDGGFSPSVSQKNTSPKFKRIMVEWPSLPRIWTLARKTRQKSPSKRKGSRIHGKKV